MAKRLSSSRIVLDIDDDDEGLSADFAKVSLANRFRLHPLAQLNPSRIRAVKAEARRQVNGLTYASDAVRAQLGFQSVAPAVWLPHPREVRPRLEIPSVRDEGRIELGFLGTARGHKGVGVFSQILGSDPRFRLHVFRGSLPLDIRRGLAGRLVEHPPGADLATVYRAVDVILLPQSLAAAAQVQLPAKLLDALSFGVPVLTSSTEAIREAARDTVTYVTDWDDTARVSEQIRAVVAEPDSGLAGKARFEAYLSMPRSAEALRLFTEDLFGLSGR
jgi:glycosyltransferase involved in cell wall biosynthesis